MSGRMFLNRRLDPSATKKPMALTVNIWENTPYRPFSLIIFITPDILLSSPMGLLFSPMIAKNLIANERSQRGPSTSHSDVNSLFNALHSTLYSPSALGNAFKRRSFKQCFTIIDAGFLLCSILPREFWSFAWLQEPTYSAWTLAFTPILTSLVRCPPCVLSSGHLSQVFTLFIRDPWFIDYFVAD